MTSECSRLVCHYSLFYHITPIMIYEWSKCLWTDYTEPSWGTTVWYIEVSQWEEGGLWHWAGLLASSTWREGCRGSKSVCVCVCVLEREEEGMSKGKDVNKAADGNCILWSFYPFQFSPEFFWIITKPLLLCFKTCFNMLQFFLKLFLCACLWWHESAYVSRPPVILKW